MSKKRFADTVNNTRDFKCSDIPPLCGCFVATGRLGALRSTKVGTDRSHRPHRKNAGCSASPGFRVGHFQRKPLTVARVAVGQHRVQQSPVYRNLQVFRVRNSSAAPHLIGFSGQRQVFQQQEAHRSHKLNIERERCNRKPVFTQANGPQ